MGCFLRGNRPKGETTPRRWRILLANGNNPIRTSHSGGIYYPHERFNDDRREGWVGGAVKGR